ncbi:hypothetical protein JKP88DRAFT_256242 [Tribonema minus]|uniref:Uncharacterized protein n=1 Tax=Tribonema minus TaxID=303371 RepID=A0A835YT54_9STRA|nr:hypothetical protein JKP88DRAFT_256242 [Tribonema minus]
MQVWIDAGEALLYQWHRLQGVEAKLQIDTAAAQAATGSFLQPQTGVGFANLLLFLGLAKATAAHVEHLPAIDSTEILAAAQHSKYIAWERASCQVRNSLCQHGHYGAGTATTVIIRTHSGLHKIMRTSHRAYCHV